MLKHMFNFEAFCSSSGKYIPFWIYEDDFILLFRRDILISPTTNTTWPMNPITKGRLERFFKDIVKRKLGWDVNLVDDCTKWCLSEWQPNRTKLVKHSRYSLYNLTKGYILTISDSQDAQKLDELLIRPVRNTTSIMKITHLIETTKFMIRLYHKYSISTSIQVGK